MIFSLSVSQENDFYQLQTLVQLLQSHTAPLSKYFSGRREGTARLSRTTSPTLRYKLPAKCPIVPRNFPSTIARLPYTMPDQGKHNTPKEKPAPMQPELPSRPRCRQASTLSRVSRAAARSFAVHAQDESINQLQPGR